MDFKYCNSLFSYSRLKTRRVNIGDVPLGGNYPVRVQSMTNTNTLDTKTTVEQCIRIINSGADYVRLTTQGRKEAENLVNIKKELRKKGYHTPLIADVHFNPDIAEMAARIVEKVRINPGNFVDREKTLSEKKYSDDDYRAGLDKIYKRLTPMLNICKDYGTAIRIGVNHGSLSDRILSRYGNTPEGMVESAMEFLHVCMNENFHDVVFSMKSSNTMVMVQAYRLLVNRMFKEGQVYPIHLGVTEAGGGEDGRIKSAVGIGSLLADGIGDTIRVSLTEEPEFEIPVAKKLIGYFSGRSDHPEIKEVPGILVNPFRYQKRKTNPVRNIGGVNVPVVVTDLCEERSISFSFLSQLGYQYDVKENSWIISDQATDFIYLGDRRIECLVPEELGMIVDYYAWKNDTGEKYRFFPLFSFHEYIGKKNRSGRLNFIKIDLPGLDEKDLKYLEGDDTVVLILQTQNQNGMAEQRALIYRLMDNLNHIPVIIQRDYKEKETEDLLLKSASDFGALLLDGLGDGVWIRNQGPITCREIISTGFGILQASRVRTTKVEYISCPSCGRTLFNLLETTAKIREATYHLKGLKIGIMGCIVNGPGEMADADYGYVGSGKGKITLYRKQEILKRNISSKDAVNELVNLIKESGDWFDP
ncbi:MAG: (E)-4-hydroxy-3-methylbut-2-enyl-diphosphate synthase [Bacteroidetes bacterium]|nr:(E)-4-hydroxy-3-methylbut-2-enyl-diphosphate synthase [Bacteroidota bacterium]